MHRSMVSGCGDHALSLLVSCRMRGGREAEVAERERWRDMENKRIMDSVQGTAPAAWQYSVADTIV